MCGVCERPLFPAAAGAAAILYTDIARDGTQEGPNLWSTEAVAKARTSCPEAKPLLKVTVALLRLMLSTSLIAKAGSMAVAAWFSV